MKTIKSFTIHKKLASCRAIFPHDDHAEVKNVTQIYDDVLKFSRPGLYSESVTRVAWELLLMQIGSGATSNLLQALGKQPPVEVQVFLSTLMTNCMNDVERITDSVDQRQRIRMLSPSSQEMLVLVPVLNFIFRFATESYSACQVALDAGVLDILLRIYIVFPTLSDTTRRNADCKVALREACRSTLNVLGQSQHQEAIFNNHPVCILWKDVRSQPPGHTIDAPTNSDEERCIAWRRVEKSCVERRMIVIYRYSLWELGPGSNVDMEACADIVEFTNRPFYESATVEFAYLAMLKHIVLSGDSALNLMDTLARGSREDTEHVFSGVIRLWLDCINMQIQTDGDIRAGVQADTMSSGGRFEFAGELPPLHGSQSFYDRQKTRLFLKMANVDNVLFNIIKFTTKAVEQNPSVRLGLLDAGSLALVLTAFANPDFRLSSLISTLAKEGKGKGNKLTRRKISDAASTPRISPASVNAEASTLSVLIHTDKFIKPWRGRQLETRLSLCSSLVDSLMGEEVVLDTEYSVTRALFRSIVTADS